jgi:ketopantoate reductase
MKIAIIGAGNVGSVLGRAWSNSGEDVVLVSRILPIQNMARCPERVCMHRGRRHETRRLGSWRRLGRQQRLPSRA